MFSLVNGRSRRVQVGLGLFAIVSILNFVCLGKDKERPKGKKPPKTQASEVAKVVDDDPKPGTMSSTAMKRPIAFAEEAIKAAETIKDYQANFIKQELIKGKVVQHSMEIKVRHEPFSVYMYFIEPHQGREVLFVDGLNNGKLWAHETGFAGLIGTISLKPDSNEAMAENRYPITEVGIKKMAELVLEQWKNESTIEGVEVKSFPNATVGEINCKMMQTRHEKKVDGVKFHMSRLYVDAKTGLPIRVEQYDWPGSDGEPILVEEYTYIDLTPNLELSDNDFDRKNRKYRF